MLVRGGGRSLLWVTDRRDLSSLKPSWLWAEPSTFQSSAHDCRIHPSVIYKRTEDSCSSSTFSNVSAHLLPSMSGRLLSTHLLLSPPPKGPHHLPLKSLLPTGPPGLHWAKLSQTLFVTLHSHSQSSAIIYLGGKARVAFISNERKLILWLPTAIHVSWGVISRVPLSLPLGMKMLMFHWARSNLVSMMLEEDARLQVMPSRAKWGHPRFTPQVINPWRYKIRSSHPENKMLHEISQTERDNHSMSLLIWGT